MVQILHGQGMVPKTVFYLLFLMTGSNLLCFALFCENVSLESAPNSLQSTEKTGNNKAICQKEAISPTKILVFTKLEKYLLRERRA